MSFYSKLESFIKRIIRVETASIRTNTVCQVVSYDGATNLAALQPCIMGIRLDDTDSPNKQLPQVADIPVYQFGSGDVMVTQGPAVGSYGLYVVSDRNVKNWILRGGVVPPAGVGRFDLSNGFFLSGLFPTIADGSNGLISPAIDTDRLSIRTRDGLTKIDVIPATGDVTITTVGQFSVNGNFTVDP